MTSETTKLDFLNKLSGGHTVWVEAFAKRCCDMFGVSFSPNLVQYHAGANATGVWDNDLLYHLAANLNIDTKGSESFIGKGFQAQSLAEQISKALSISKDQPNGAIPA